MAKQKLSYDEAIGEIETTLEQIENGSLGVDELAEKVAHVTRLLKLCRERLYQTETRIGKILDEAEDNGGSTQKAGPGGEKE